MWLDKKSAKFWLEGKKLENTENVWENTENTKQDLTDLLKEVESVIWEIDVKEKLQEIYLNINFVLDSLLQEWYFSDVLNFLLMENQLFLNSPAFRGDLEAKKALNIQDILLLNGTESLEEIKTTIYKVFSDNEIDWNIKSKLAEYLRLNFFVNLNDSIGDINNMSWDSNYVHDFSKGMVLSNYFHNEFHEYSFTLV